ncbi:MAG: MFS transporter [Dechloromonas sp.]|nr:MFS transporter [Dechloromonas sp.]
MAIHVADAGIDIQYTPKVSRTFAWIVFALTFGLLLSDYMSRQVLNAVFPVLKAEWDLSDTQLGSLNSIVSLLVGLLTFPLSLLADRWGRVRSIVLMAALWSLATAACAIAENYGQMFAARFFVGVGEAAYGSVGIAVIIAVFPPHLRSTLSGAFLAGGAFGSVLGMALGGVIGAKFAWRWAFGAMALFGVALVILYALVVTEKRLNPDGPTRTGDDSDKRCFPSLRGLLSGLFSSVSVCCAYVGSGLQLFMMGSMMAWLPSFANRYYELPADRAGLFAAAFVLVGAVGMTSCGIITDRLSRNFATRKWTVAIAYSLISSAALIIGFHLPNGPAQLLFLAVGMFFVAGTTGPVGAMVANLTNPAIHATAFATWSLANNLIGMAPGPFLTGALADRIGLLGALQWMPLVGLAAAATFVLGRRTYAGDLQRIRAEQAREKI